ncbi:MAG TPA: hypothetical protein VFQ34_13730 [Nitrospiraceae bacterium]|nr:hypothetical protein [Nitrospiraceae bacterium]
MTRQSRVLGLMIRLLFACLAVQACRATPPATEGYVRQMALRGMSTSEVLACAGPPTRQFAEGDAILMRYYREAPMLEESTVGSKGSHAGVHHGCWATLVVRADRVESVRYRFVPSDVDASNDCEDIFANCSQ